MDNLPSAQRVLHIRPSLMAAINTDEPAVALRKRQPHDAHLHACLLHELTLGWFTLSELAERTGLSRSWVAYRLEHRSQYWPHVDIRTRRALPSLARGGCSVRGRDKCTYRLTGCRTPSIPVVLDWQRDD